MAKKFKIVVCSKVYKVADDGSETLQTEDAYTWHGCDAAQRHVIENTLDKHVDNVRVDLKEAGLLAAVTSGEITPEQAAGVRAFSSGAPVVQPNKTGQAGRSRR